MGRAFPTFSSGPSSSIYNRSLQFFVRPPPAESEFSDEFAPEVVTRRLKESTATGERRIKDARFVGTGERVPQVSEGACVPVGLEGRWRKGVNTVVGWGDFESVVSGEGERR